MTTVTWTRSPERSVYVAEAGGAVLTVTKRVDLTWAAQAKWPPRSATQYGFRTRLAAQAWCEQQVAP
jgi:hypothetical protein